jgi:hypothetical protein
VLAGVAGNVKKFDEELALTNRFRTEVTDTMLEAARLVGARRFIAQSFCGWPFARDTGSLCDARHGIHQSVRHCACWQIVAVD